MLRTSFNHEGISFFLTDFFLPFISLIDFIGVLIFSLNFNSLSELSRFRDKRDHFVDDKEVIKQGRFKGLPFSLNLLPFNVFAFTG